MVKSGDLIRYKGSLGKAIQCSGDSEDILRFYPVGFGSYYPEKLEVLKLDLVEKAKEEDKILYIERECPWGRIIKTHQISNIQIIEWHNDKDNVTGFSTYVDFIDQSYGTDNLDDAIITALSSKYNSNGYTSAILKLLGRLKE